MTTTPHMPWQFDVRANRRTPLPETACLLTMLHARKGDRADAQTWLEKARYWNPECYLLPRAEAGLTGGEKVAQKSVERAREWRAAEGKQKTQ